MSSTKDSKAEWSGKALEMSAALKAWERQPAESPQAFEAFQAYLRVKEEKAGGQREVARRLGKSNALMDKWSKRNRWVDRHRAYENYQLMLQEREQTIALREQARQWAARRVDIREHGFGVGEALLKRANALLSLPMWDKIVRDKIVLEDGREIETRTELVFHQHPRDARLLAETGLKLMRLSADMSTENFGLPEAVDWETLPDEEVDAYITRLLELRTLALGGDT